MPRTPWQVGPGARWLDAPSLTVQGIRYRVSIRPHAPSKAAYQAHGMSGCRTFGSTSRRAAAMSCSRSTSCLARLRLLQSWRSTASRTYRTGPANHRVAHHRGRRVVAEPRVWPRQLRDPFHLDQRLRCGGAGARCCGGTARALRRETALGQGVQYERGHRARTLRANVGVQRPRPRLDPTGKFRNAFVDAYVPPTVSEPRAPACPSCWRQTAAE